MPPPPCTTCAPTLHTEHLISPSARVIGDVVRGAAWPAAAAARRS